MIDTRAWFPDEVDLSGLNSYELFLYEHKTLVWVFLFLLWVFFVFMFIEISQRGGSTVRWD